MPGSSDRTQKGPPAVTQSERPGNPVPAPAGSRSAPADAPAASLRSTGDPDGKASGGSAADRRLAPPSREELERVRARDPEALGAFFERYFGRVYGLVY